MSAPVGICPRCRVGIDPRSGTMMVAGFVVTLGIPLAAPGALGALRVAGSPVAAAGALATPFLFARFRRFEPVGDRRGRRAR